MTPNMNKAKNFDSSYLYGQGDFSKKMYEFIITSRRIDKTDKSFDEIRYLIKKNQYTSCLSTLLDKGSIVLMINPPPIPRAFKVFCAKDIKEDKASKVFIDVSEIVGDKDGEYSIKNKDVDIFISYLSCALNTLIYYTDLGILVNNSVLVQCGCTAFAKLSANIIDYLRIGGVDNVRAKVLYISALYYQVKLLGKDVTDLTRRLAIKISGLTSREADILDVMVPVASFENIKTFVETIAKVIKVDALRLETFVDKWIYLYGSGTQYAMELYPSFANMLINAYVGAYINNQKQIEKLVGREMVEFTNTLFRKGCEIL